MSAGTMIASPSNLFTSASRLLAEGRSEAYEKTTFARARARWSTMERPIPRDPPVTTATEPFRSIIGSSLGMYDAHPLPAAFRRLLVPAPSSSPSASRRPRAGPGDPGSPGPGWTADPQPYPSPGPTLAAEARQVVQRRAAALAARPRTDPRLAVRRRRVPRAAAPSSDPGLAAVWAIDKRLAGGTRRLVRGAARRAGAGPAAGRPTAPAQSRPRRWRPRRQACRRRPQRRGRGFDGSTSGCGDAPARRGSAGWRRTVSPGAAGRASR